MAKFKIVKSRHGRSDELIAQADNLDELVRIAEAKTGGAGFGTDLGLGLDDGEGLL